MTSVVCAAAPIIGTIAGSCVAIIAILSLELHRRDMARQRLLVACKMALNDRQFDDWPTIAPHLIAAIAKAEF